MKSIERYLEAPFMFEPTQRQWVVAVGSLARDIFVAKYGMAPSREVIEDYIEKIREALVPVMDRFFTGAALRVKEELVEALLISAEDGGSVRQVRINSIESLRKRYVEIDKDTERSYSYLDPLLLKK